MQRMIVGLLALSCVAAEAYAFESTKVLPKGVRNVNLRTVNTDFEEKTDGRGTKQPLAQPLAQSLTFAKIAKGEDPLKADSLRAFLLNNGMSESDEVGNFTADLKGHLSVVAPIVSYGLTERLTLALAAPVYSASTSISVGFQPNDRAKAFIAALTDPQNNQTVAAREAALKLNTAVERLNDKLATNGYRELEDWQGQGLGDMTLAGKYRWLNAERLALASTSGVVAPTGRPKDPDILTDIPFGDGQWDIFHQFALDERLIGGLTWNQYAKYTVQLPGSKDVRAITNDEAIEQDYTRTSFKLGDKVDAGTSLQYEPAFGLVAGVGYTYFRKYGDVYRGEQTENETKALLQKGTDQEAYNAEFRLGYSTVPFYMAKSFAVPLDLALTYTRQLKSRNMPVTDLAQFDFNLYF